jgi:hypothetical protein
MPTDTVVWKRPASLETLTPTTRAPHALEPLPVTPTTPGTPQIRSDGTVEGRTLARERSQLQGTGDRSMTTVKFLGGAGPDAATLEAIARACALAAAQEVLRGLAPTLMQPPRSTLPTTRPPDEPLEQYWMPDSEPWTPAQDSNAFLRSRLSSHRSTQAYQSAPTPAYSPYVHRDPASARAMLYGLGRPLSIPNPYAPTYEFEPPWY